MELSERLAQLRRARGWSQTELAERLDVSRQAVSRWEVGTSFPSMEKLLALADAYGLSLAALLQGDEAVPAPAEAVDPPVPAEPIPTARPRWIRWAAGGVAVAAAVGAIWALAGGPGGAAVVDLASLPRADLSQARRELLPLEYQQEDYPRFTDRLDWTVPAGTVGVSMDAFWLEDGGTVTLTCAATPRTARLEVGLLAPDGWSYHLDGTGGTVQTTLRVTEPGYYYLTVRNVSQETVTVLGFAGHEEGALPAPEP